MTTLAPKLPYDHPFAGGYPRIGGQPLPTDPDAIDYLARVAAADGAAVEQGVAMAVDGFVRGCKADSAGYAGDPTRTVWDALQACCIMAGARTISGALVPLVGTAPTPVPYNFTGFDYDRSTGLKGDGSSTYLDSNRAENADGQDDNHYSVWSTTLGTGVLIANAGTANTTISPAATRNRSTTADFLTVVSGFAGISRSESASYTQRTGGTDYPVTRTSASSSAATMGVFATGSGSSPGDHRLAFYSIGSALDLSALDTRVTSLVQRIQLTLASGLDVSTYDDATVAYLLAGYNNGASLE